jgi:ribosomal protein S18 acetylase RimI-like enzyme
MSESSQRRARKRFGMIASFDVVALSAGPLNTEELSELLIEAVEHGGSVSYMHPLAPQAAAEFWQAALLAAARGGRVILGARVGHKLIGTVTLGLDVPENQPHRAEISKLITRVSYRGQGVARALMRSAEREAIERGRALLTLDTASDGGAAQFYEKLGYERAGVIPDYALKPHGGLTDTIVYWKRIGQPATFTRD